jgi:hypothetical protein
MKRFNFKNISIEIDMIKQAITILVLLLAVNSFAQNETTNTDMKKLPSVSLRTMDGDQVNPCWIACSKVTEFPCEKPKLVKSKTAITVAILGKDFAFGLIFSNQ